jgi:hypothetical protein
MAVLMRGGDNKLRTTESNNNNMSKYKNEQRDVSRDVSVGLEAKRENPRMMNLATLNPQRS